MLTLTCLGGAGTVTGSKQLLTDGGNRILIDCGPFQGFRNLRELNQEALAVSPSSIDAVARRKPCASGSIASWAGMPPFPAGIGGSTYGRARLSCRAREACMHHGLVRSRTSGVQS